MEHLDTFTDAMLTAALWSSCDDDDTPLDYTYSVDDIDPATLARLKADAHSFWARVHFYISDHAMQAGHDFWLTRNGHGAGFWDRGGLYAPYDPDGQRLTDMAKAYGEVDLYVSGGVIHA